jgi:TatD DNase family protein
MKYFDTHAHINCEPLKSRLSSIVSEANQAGIFINCVGIDLPSSIDSLSTASKFDNVFCSVGIHPTEVHKTDLSAIIEIDNLLATSNPKIIGIGETGLDYYHSEDTKELQKLFLIKHIELAIKYKKPLILHIRNAHDDAYKIIKEYRSHLSNVLIHCFDEKIE